MVRLYAFSRAIRGCILMMGRWPMVVLCLAGTGTVLAQQQQQIGPTPVPAPVTEQKMTTSWRPPPKDDAFHRCADREDTSTALVDQLPRYALDMQKTSAEMSEFTWFKWDDKCTKTPLVCIQDGRYRPESSVWGEPCGPGCYQTNIDVHPNSGSDQDNAGRYVQGAVVLAGIWFVLAMWTLAVGGLCTGYTICTCLCCRKRKHVKVEKKKTAVEDDDEDPDAAKLASSCWYGCKCQLILQLMVVLPMISILVFVWVGEVKGNSNFVPSLQSVIASPRAFADLTQDAFSLGDKVAVAGQRVISEVLAVNRTVSEAVDFGEVTAALGCIEGMLQGLPDLSAVVAELQRTQAAVGSIPSSADMAAVIGRMQTPITTLQGLVISASTELGVTRTALRSLTGCPVSPGTCTFNSSEGLLSALDSQMLNATVELQTAQADASALKANITAFLALRQSSLTSITALKSDVENLINNPSSYPGNHMNLLAKTDAAVADIRQLSNASPGLIAEIQRSQASAAAINFTGVLSAGTDVDQGISAVNSSLLAVAAVVATMEQTLGTFSTAELKTTMATVDNVTTTGLPNNTLISHELGKINSTIAALACVTPLLTIVQRINDTLVVVPPSASSIVDMLRQADTASSGMGSSFGGVTAQLDTFTTSTQVITTMNTSSYTAQIDGVDAQIKGVSFASVTSQIQSVDAVLQSAGAAAWRDPLVAAQSTLDASDFSTPPTLCCNSTSLLGSFNTTAEDAAVTLEVFHGQVSACNSQCAGTSLNQPATQTLVLLNMLESSLGPAGLGQLSAVGTALDPLIAITPPDTTTTTSQLQASFNSVRTGDNGLHAADTLLTSVSVLLTGSSSAFTSLQLAWDDVASVFAPITPMLDSAISMVLGSATALNALPADSIVQVTTIRLLVDQLITMKDRLGANITSAQAFIADGRETLRIMSEDNVLHQMFHGVNQSFTMPKLTGDVNIGVADVFNMTRHCKTVGCFQEAVQYFDDNFLDVIAHIVAEQLDSEPVKIGFSRTLLFGLFYAIIGTAAVLILAGSIFYILTLRCLGALILWPMSVLFLLLATVLFPTVTLLSDTCGSVERLGYTIVSKDTHLGLYSDQLLIKNVTELQDYTKLVPFANFSSNLTYQFNDIRIPGIPRLIETYFGDCAYGASSGNVTVDATVREIGKLTENITLELIDYGVVEVSRLSGELRPGMQQHIWNLRNITDGTVYDLFGHTSQLFGCPRFNAAYFAVKDALCCDFVLMLYWMAMSCTILGCCGCFGTCSVGFSARSLRRKPPTDSDSDDSDDSDDDEISPEPRMSMRPGPPPAAPGYHQHHHHHPHHDPYAHHHHHHHQSDRAIYHGYRP
jgi:hypothetical protein